MSRLPIPSTEEPSSPPAELIALVNHSESIPLTITDLRKSTEKDPVLSRVVNLVRGGWPENVSDVPSDCISYYRRQTELSLLDGCLLWGTRVIIPTKLRAQDLEELHHAHPGVVKMKGLARSYVWWPKLDSEIEQKVRDCTICQSHPNSTLVAPLHPWDWMTRPWSRLHIDYAGTYQGHMFLVVIDSHTKWLEVFPVKAATSFHTTEKLRMLFSSFGLPHKIVSDNGSVFTSQEFQDFMKSNGIIHVKVSPYHPSSNRLAERAVQIFKRGLERQTEGSLECKLSKVLFNYRVTPKSTTAKSPAELLSGRKLKSHLDLLYPDLQGKVESKVEKQKESHDRHSRFREFKEEDTVFVRNYRTGPKWREGTVCKRLGPVSYIVKFKNGVELRRHIDQLHKRTSLLSETDESDISFDDFPGVTSERAIVDASLALPPIPGPRRSTRIRKPPDRYF